MCPLAGGTLPSRNVGLVENNHSLNHSCTIKEKNYEHQAIEWKSDSGGDA